MRLLLRLYPPAWRERYGDELTGLIDDTGTTPRVVADVARGAAREWADAARVALAGGGTMVLGPAWRHPTWWALVALAMLTPTLTFVLLSILVYQLGLTGLSGVMQPFNALLDSQRVLDLLLVGTPVLALLVAAAPLLRLEIRRSDAEREAVLGVRLRWLNVTVGLLALLIGGLLIGHILFESVLRLGA